MNRTKTSLGCSLKEFFAFSKTNRGGSTPLLNTTHRRSFHNERFPVIKVALRPDSLSCAVDSGADAVPFLTNRPRAVSPTWSLFPYPVWERLSGPFCRSIAPSPLHEPEFHEYVRHGR